MEVDFLRQRGASLALVVAVMGVIALAQGAVSYTFVMGQLKGRLPIDFAAFSALGNLVRWGLIAWMTALWISKHRRRLFRVVVFTNALATVGLLIDTVSLGSVLAGLSSRAVVDLIADVALIALANILVFSIWYWVLDPPGVDGVPRDNEPWAFLFPQRAADLPHYEAWAPRYQDYLFVAFTTSFAFSPTDTLPLTPTAKMLMMLQSTISVVTLTGIAGSAVNILAG